LNFLGQGVGGGSGVVASGGTVHGAVKWIFFIFCAEQILHFRHQEKEIQ
jgi:hypothetical protein